MKLYKFLFVIFLFSASALAQGESIALAPARVELEMQPGAETTFVVNLDYRASNPDAKAARIVASLNDWNISENGQVEFYKAGTQPNSACSWIIYSPSEKIVAPGTTHSIRVTVSVPADAAPGDHLAALIVEERPDNLKVAPQNLRQIVVRYRMASMIYIKVGRLEKRGTLENLQAETSPKGIVVTPTLKNEGNSVIRPTASIKIFDEKGSEVADISDFEPLPILAKSTISQATLIEKQLLPGTYTVKYKIDFQDGSRAVEGVTDFTVKPTLPVNIASSKP
jgi:methionine-rich copper-binding protein CopC